MPIKKDIDRLQELSQRTHQFNLLDKHCSIDDITAFFNDPNYKIFSLSVNDKYGDMGIVGMAIVNNNIIEAFMLSCRAFDRDFEHVLLNTVKEHTDKELCGIFIDNGKNSRYSNFFSDNGVKTL